MSSNVDRQAVLRNTKVRTALRKDGSWIHRSSEELSDNHEPSEPPVPVKLVGSRLFSTAAAQTPPSPAPQNQDTPTTPDTPTAPDTPTTPDTPTAPDTPTSPVGKGSPRSSYVFSAIRKFENTESPDSSPVKTSHSSQMVKREMFPENAASGWKTPLTPAKTQPVPHATSAKPSGIAPTTFAKQPTTKTSITQKPVVKTPAAQTPAVKELAETARPTLPQVKTPAERVPVAETPAAKTPQVKTPAEKVPLAETPAAKTPQVKTPAEKVPLAETPAAKTPQVKTQAEKVPVAETAAAKTPEVKTPAEKVPVAETPAAKTPEVKTPAEKVPVAETPAVKTHQVKTPAEKVPVAETPAVKTPQVKTPAEKVPVAETPAVKTAVPKIPVTETPAVPEPEVKTPAPPAVNLLPETSEPRAAPQIVLEPAASRTTSSKPQLIGASNPLCSFCMKPVDGRVKITITDPLICCHQDCFKCATCSVPLGDLVFAMFHHKGKIHCEKCFSAIFSHS